MHDTMIHIPDAESTHDAAPVHRYEMEVEAKGDKRRDESSSSTSHHMTGGHGDVQHVPVYSGAGLSLDIKLELVARIVPRKEPRHLSSADISQPCDQ